jgi:hypothetical protein
MYATAGIHCANGAESWRRFQSRFPNRKRVFLPVVYVADEKPALHNADTAEAAQADGLFLINNGIGYQRLLRIARKIIDHHSNMFVGVNCLDLRPQDVICRLPDSVDGVWTSDAPNSVSPVDTAAAIRQARQRTGWDGLFFGSPATKTDEQTTGGDSLGHIDVPTVVGQESAQRRNRLIRKLRARFGAWPLAVAADITTDTVDAVLPYANCIMTTASADSGLEAMDQGVAEELAARAHAYTPPIEEG